MLDGLRAVSVFVVIFEHVVGNKGALAHIPGWLGVDIFFLLSGFLITGLLIDEENTLGSINFKAFYWKRAFRILPVYWVTLAAYILLSCFQPDKWSQMKAGLPFFLTLNNELAFIFRPSEVGSFFGLSWSLAVEEKFYVLWPTLLFLVYRSLKGRLAVLITLYAAALLFGFIEFRMSRSYHGLLVGSAVALALSYPRWTTLKTLIARTPVTLLLAATLISAGLVAWKVAFVYAFSWVAAILMAHLLLTDNWLGRLLSIGPLTWIGKRSYAMYLLQGFALNLLTLFIRPVTPLRCVLLALIAFGVVSLAADVMHRLVEGPCRQFGRRFGAKSSTAPSASRGSLVTSPEPVTSKF